MDTYGGAGSAPPFRSLDVSKLSYSVAHVRVAKVYFLVLARLMACADIRYMFLVGGFSESPMLQVEMRKEFCHLLKIIIPQDVALTILKGSCHRCT